MTPSVWRRAAELVDRTYPADPEERYGCCRALRHTSATHRQEYEFSKIFGPKKHFSYWWDDPYNGATADRTARVIALLLMELIERDSDDR